MTHVNHLLSPALRADVRLGEDISLEVGDWAYELEGASRLSLTTVAAYADGTRSVAELESLAGGGSDFRDLIDVLHDEQIFRVDRALGPVIGPSDFTRVCRELFPYWKRRIFEKELWTGLSAGTLARQVFVGWVIESYHFIEGANLRLPYAVAFCFEKDARDAFAHHYGEEYDHGQFYLRALDVLGIDHTVAESLPPLASTTAILNHMRRCARLDPLAYAVCSGFLESTGEDRESGREFLSLLDQHFASDASVTGPLLEHLQLDEDYGHNGLLEDTCQFFGTLTLDRASAALDAGLRLVETLEYWSDALITVYGADGQHHLLPDETYEALRTSATKAGS